MRNETKALQARLRASKARRDSNGRALGKANEDRVFIAIQSRQKLWPSWLTYVRKSVVQEDHSGFDLIAKISTGESIGIQIKSSRKAAIKFQIAHPTIPVIVCKDEMKDSQLFLLVIDVIKRKAFPR